tara:strand:- start:1637 stop:2668 length:1032 start_codon:yes stop_codon:yes gene_type:complete
MKIMKKLKNSQTPIDILVIGSGNIAIRHIKNIKEIYPLKTIYVLKRTNLHLDKYFNNKDIKIIKNLRDIIPMNKKSIALICSPASMHLGDIKTTIKKGFNIFIEKPLMTNREKISSLLKTISQTNKLTHVGYNMRFTDRIDFIKNQLLKYKISKITSVNIIVSTDFRKWRKNKNYKDTVSFHRSLGGGVINELSHEVDYMIYLFGKPKSVKVYKLDNHQLKSDVEFNIKAVFYYNNLDINFKANMLSNINERRCTITTADNDIDINHLTNLIKTSDKKHNKNHNIVKFNDSDNDSYLKEIKYIFECLSKNVQSLFSIESLISTQYVLNAMHSSLNQQKRIYLK